MAKFMVTVVETIERIYEGIELNAFSPEQAEELALQIDLKTLKPTFDEVVETHVEADLA